MLVLFVQLVFFPINIVEVLLILLSWYSPLWYYIQKGLAQQVL